MKKVVILQSAKKFNTAGAESLGEKVEIIPEHSVFQTDEFQEDCLKQLQAVEYDPEVDQLVLTGSALEILLLFSAVTKEFDPPYNVLMYYAPSGQYKERVIW